MSLSLSCSEIPALASDYLAHRLALGQRLKVGLHLLQCEACRAYMRGLARTARLAADGLRGGPAPEALLERLGLGAAEDGGGEKTRVRAAERGPPSG